MEQIPIYDLKALKMKFGLSVRTWREYIKRKELRAYLVGRAYFVTEADLRHFLSEKEAYSYRKRGVYPFKEDQDE